MRAIRPQYIPTSTPIAQAFGTFQSDHKVLVGVSEQNGLLHRLKPVLPSQENVQLKLKLGDGTAVTITIRGGKGTAVQIGNQVQLTLTGSPIVTITTRGGSNSLSLGDVTASGSIRSFIAPTATLAGKFTVQGKIGVLRVKRITGIVVSSGDINSLTAGDMSGSISCGGTLRVANLGAISGIIAAAQIRILNAASIDGATILAGANLGSDGELGGVGSAQDTFRAGQILALTVKTSITASFIGAGVNPFDGIFGDGDDTLAGAGNSSINSIIARRGLDAVTKFEAASFPRFAHLPRPTSTANNSQFVVV